MSNLLSQPDTFGNYFHATAVPPAMPIAYGNSYPLQDSAVGNRYQQNNQNGKKKAQRAKLGQQRPSGQSPERRSEEYTTSSIGHNDLTEPSDIERRIRNVRNNDAIFR